MNHTRQLKDAVFKLEARGMDAEGLHGDLGKLGRSTILKKFKSGQVRVLVTNELAARGSDVPECDLVVNLDLPTDSIHYAHRAGRTVRLGGKGPVLTICEEPEVFVVKKLQKLLGVSIPDASLQRASLLSLKSGEKCGGLESAYHNDEESDNRRGRENDDRLPDRCSFINLLDGQYIATQLEEIRR
ncbi:hypothetical protein POTOM_000871 [Populus tomentosa]|uniref:RNA helicase n=1 Tax=Populus tomentosa TaxID=118781 RepID=A0A8X8DGZ0_POPTO|nr:hypothetical protein POTOM_000871 [Populus tomentosa]